MTFEEIMDFAIENRGKFDDLVKDCKSKGSVILPVVGAGLSADFGYPDWKGLLLKIIKKINNKEDQNKLIGMVSTGADYESITEKLQRFEWII